jgi:histidinol-phosphate aminotransferase
MAAARRSINRHPDPRSTRVRALLAERHGIDAERIAVGNGASELMQAAAFALLDRGDEMLVPWPSCGLYPVLAQRAGVDVVRAPLRDHAIDPAAIDAAITPRTRAVAICNPNDPTGTRLDSRSIGSLVDALPDRVHVLLDEALVHFQDAEEEDACLRLVNGRPRLLVFRSFSAAYAMAGVRAGYAIGSEDSVDLIDRLAPALGMSELVQVGLEHALRSAGVDLAERRSIAIRERRRFTEALADLPFEAPPSQAHFVWLRADGITGAELAGGFDRHRLKVADGDRWGDRDHVRVTLQGPEAVDRILRALRGVAGETAAPVAGSGSPGGFRNPAAATVSAR